MSREQIIAEMRERANDLREQGKLASANAMEDFADRLAALTASPQAAPEGVNDWAEVALCLSNEVLPPEQCPDTPIRWLNAMRAHHEALCRALTSKEASPHQVKGGEVRQDLAIARATIDSLRMRLAGCEAALADRDAKLADTPQRAPGVDALPAKWRGQSHHHDGHFLANGDIYRMLADELEAALASGPSGECQHRWQPDADVEGAVYCPKCDVTRSARAAAQDQGEGK